MADLVSPPKTNENQTEPDLDQLIKGLQAKAISAHQDSVGRGNQLVKLLLDAVTQLKGTHSRIQNMSAAFFILGIVIMGLGVFMALFGSAGKEVWGTILGAGGGLGAAVTMFYTGPLTKISNSVTNLIKLETAFLGYIRVVGEVDSAFQWQYLERLSGSQNVNIATIADATTRQMKEMMTHTMSLIDQYVAEETPSMTDLKRKLDEASAEIAALKAKVEGSGK